MREKYFKYNHLSNVKNMPWNDMFSLVLTDLGVATVTQRDIIARIDADQTKSIINERLLALLPALKRHRLRLAILSNSTSKLRERIEKNGIAKHFDEIVISGEIGFQKPSKEAFEILCSRLQVTPPELVFVDDTSKSLEGANEIGYTPILFKDNEQLEHDLSALGIKC